MRSTGDTEEVLGVCCVSLFGGGPLLGDRRVTVPLLSSEETGRELSQIVAKLIEKEAERGV